MSERAEVVVVDAGFAGVAAARELSRLGLEAVVVEARDRLGGRTWFERRLGAELELGGTWVHPFQPHVWAEVRRLDLPVIRSPVPTEAAWIDRDGLHRGSAAELWAPLEEPMERFAAAAGELFPTPFEPLAAGERLAALDRRSVADALAELELPPALLDRARAL